VARSGIRQYWHVWQVMQDTSKYAATPALGYASKMISLCVLIFLSLVAFVFWLGGLAEKSTFVATSDAEKGARHVGHYREDRRDRARDAGPLYPPRHRDPAGAIRGAA